MIFEIIVLFLAIIVLLAFSAFFSGSETALTASTRSRLTGLGMKGKKNSNVAIDLLNKKEALIGAILLGNNLVNILASALATSLLIKIFGNTGVAYAVIIMTALIVIFAEILPKSYAIANAEKMALLVSPFLKPFVTILAPVTWLMEKIVFTILNIIGIKHDQNARSLSVADEIRGTVDLHHKEGRLFKMDKDMVTGILDLSETTVEDIMVHRSNIFMVNIDEDPEKIINQVVESPYTRIPVFSGTQDNIIGILHAKELFRFLQRNKFQDTKSIDLKNILIDPYFAPETTPILDQLEIFRGRKEHFAIVVNEYGDFRGIVTLEDILEEIVGEIDDETDINVEGVKSQPDGSLIIDGSVTIRDLNRSLAWDLPDENYNTIAGLVVFETKTIPNPGQEFRFFGIKIRILQKDKNFLSKLRLWKEQENNG